MLKEGAEPRTLKKTPILIKDHKAIRESAVQALMILADPIFLILQQLLINLDK